MQTRLSLLILSLVSIFSGFSALASVVPTVNGAVVWVCGVKSVLHKDRVQVTLCMKVLEKPTSLEIDEYESEFRMEHAKWSEGDRALFEDYVAKKRKSYSEGLVEHKKISSRYLLELKYKEEYERLIGNALDGNQISILRSRSKRN